MQNEKLFFMLMKSDGKGLEIKGFLGGSQLKEIISLRNCAYMYV